MRFCFVFLNLLILHRTKANKLICSTYQWYSCLPYFEIIIHFQLLFISSNFYWLISDRHSTFIKKCVLKRKNKCLCNSALLIKLQSLVNKSHLNSIFCSNFYYRHLVYIFYISSFRYNYVNIYKMTIWKF